MVQLKEKLRSVTFLTRQQIDFLDKMSKDALFYKGKRLSRVMILSELVDFLMKSGVDVKTIDLENSSLSEAILKILKQGTEQDQKEDKPDA